MATMNAAEVGVGSAKATGAIWIAPQGTALPTDATTALGSTFKLLGLFGLHPRVLHFLPTQRPH